MPLLPFPRLPYLRLHFRIRVPTIAVLHNGSTQLPLHQRFSTTAPALAKPLPPRRPLLDDEITESFLKGSGPGGQKINKTSSAVQLKHLPTGIVVKCQETRSRSQNRKMARRLLQERIEEVELGELARTRVRAREVASRKKSADKKRRRKYRALEKGKDGEVEREEGIEDRQGGNAEGRALAEGEAPMESSHAEGSGKAG